MEPDVKVAKWGNSLAVRLPKSVVESLGLTEGDEIDVAVANERKLLIRKTPDRLQMIEDLRKYRGLIPADFKFDRDEANSRD
jgi:antitoxin MazE